MAGKTNGLWFRWLRFRGYRVDTVVNVRHIDDLFSNPPRVYRRSSKLVMRRGLATRTLRFRHLTAESLEDALDARLESPRGE